MENNSGEGNNLVVPFSIAIDPLYAHAQRNGDTNLLTDILERGCCVILDHVVNYRFKCCLHEDGYYCIIVDREQSSFNAGTTELVKTSYS